MKSCRFLVRTGLAVLLAGVLVNSAFAQPDPKLKPTFGSVKLKAGFEPDPYKKDLVAGGDIATKLGGVSAYVAKEPDFVLEYTAGDFPLIFRAQSKADTTLLIYTPDGKWLADDDGGGFPNPLVRIAKPMSGRYAIYVGTVEKGTPKATLLITEVDVKKGKKTDKSVNNGPAERNVVFRASRLEVSLVSSCKKR